MTQNMCIGCGHRASGRARFCEQCGSALTAGAEPLRPPGPLAARILDGRPAIEGERKQVTVMYTDVVGSMALTRALDAERWGAVLDRFLGIAARAVHDYEGTVNQFTGDGLLAVFGAPLAHEDHARRACLAVLELQREVAALAAVLQRTAGVEFAVRCGLNSGEVVVGAIGDDVHMDFVPIGNTTAVGKRIESLAPAGSTAISDSTAALVEGEFELRELGTFELKGVDGRRRILELVGPGPAQTRLAAVAATRGLSPFLGRDAEIAALRRALARAGDGSGGVVRVVGDAGVGKSRLVHEFVAGCAARGVPVVSTRGVAHGRYVPLLPVLGLVREVLGLRASDPPGVARARVQAAVSALRPEAEAEAALPGLLDLLGLAAPARSPAGPDPDPVARRRRVAALVADLLAARGGGGAVVAVVEDLHWLDDASAAVVDDLAAAVAGTRVLLVLTHRLEHAVAWADDDDGVGLGPLDADATDGLLTGLLGLHPSTAGLAQRIDARAGGNPFFLEEIVQALVESGHLAGDRGAYRLVAPLDELVLPATVQAGLAARMDRLPAREKTLVQTMAVIGTAVPDALLREVAGLAEHELSASMAALETARWVVPRGPGDRGEHVFKHPLIQEVAYGALLSERRAGLHDTVAAAIERTSPEGLDEHAALLAHHHEQAGGAPAAAHWHARAAAWSQDASPADGMRHWRRVRELVSALGDDPAHAELASRARIGVLSLGWRLGINPAEAAAIHAEVYADAGESPVDLWFAGSLMHGGREHEGLDGFRAVWRGAVAAGDDGLALTASAGVAYAAWVAGSLREGLEATEHALRRAADDPQVGAGLAFRCPLAHAYADRGQCRGHLGELEAARRDVARGIALAREHGDPETESAAYANLALLEADAGRAEAARTHARRGLELAERAGNVVHVVACEVPLAVADAAGGRPAEALARAAAVLATVRGSTIGLYFEPALLAAVARARLELGDADAALAAAEEAVAIADARELGACALQAPLALAHVLRQTGGADPAAGARAEAVLERAALTAAASGSRVFELRIRREQAGARRPGWGRPRPPLRRQ